MEQMRVTVLEARDRALVELIVDALDDNGYLTETLEEIHERMPPELEIDADELKTALSLLQSFDPVGVGALRVRMPGAADPRHEGHPDGHAAHGAGDRRKPPGLVRPANSTS
ncbi:hypothetical protein LP420_16485 [Massilia sp. B-10]|nr:hypothetical protein LP420_16485 [Massilia sp. B-10]